MNSAVSFWFACLALGFLPLSTTWAVEKYELADMAESALLEEKKHQFQEEQLKEQQLVGVIEEVVLLGL